MSAESLKTRKNQRRLSKVSGSQSRQRLDLFEGPGRATVKRPGTIIYLECLDLDLANQVARRLESWARARGWRVTLSQLTLHPENSAPTPGGFPFHDPLAWPLVGREGEWIEAHRRDVTFFGEPPAGTLHLQCSGWLRTLACLRARGLDSQAETLEGVGAELPCPDYTFMLIGPSFFGDSALESEAGWRVLSQAFQTRVAAELESAAVNLLGAKVVEGNAGWSAAHYGLQIESVLTRVMES